MIYALKVSNTKTLFERERGAGAERITMHLKYVCALCSASFAESAHSITTLCLCIYANICTLRKVWENNAINVTDTELIAYRGEKIKSNQFWFGVLLVRCFNCIYILMR